METEVLFNFTMHFMLILIRIAAIFTFSPVFGRRNVPAMFKIGFSVMLSLILYNLFPAPSNQVFNLYAYTISCLKEMFVGLLIGYVTVMVFSVANMAGQLIDVQIGFGMAQLFSHEMGTQVSINANLLNIVMLICFFITNGHHALIRILANTFYTLPPGNFTINFDMTGVIVSVFVSCIVMGVQIAMPIVAATFITEMIMGILMRTVPQMNMFIIGIPLKVIIGLLLLVLISPMFVQMTQPLFSSMYDSINDLLGGVAA